MPAAPLARRTFAAAAAAWALGSTRPAAAAPGPYAAETGVWTGSVLQDAEGQSFVLRDFRHPLTLLKLWAGWCPACAGEMPQLEALASTVGQGVEVILISHPQFWAADQAMARRRRLPFRMATFAPSNPGAVVEQALLERGGVFAVPKSLAFRARDQSIVLKRETPTDWSSGPALTQIKGLMA